MSLRFTVLEGQTQQRPGIAQTFPEQGPQEQLQLQAPTLAMTWREMTTLCWQGTLGGAGAATLSILGV